MQRHRRELPPAVGGAQAQRVSQQCQHPQGRGHRSEQRHGHRWPLAHAGEHEGRADEQETEGGVRGHAPGMQVLRRDVVRHKPLVQAQGNAGEVLEQDAGTEEGGQRAADSCRPPAREGQGQQGAAAGDEAQGGVVLHRHVPGEHLQQRQVVSVPADEHRNAQQPCHRAGGGHHSPGEIGHHCRDLLRLSEGSSLITGRVSGLSSSSSIPPTPPWPAARAQMPASAVVRSTPAVCARSGRAGAGVSRGHEAWGGRWPPVANRSA